MSLFEEVKNYLDITWEDPATESKVAGILSRSQDVLSKYAGEELDFSDETEKQLLFDCCRYIYNNCFEDFKTNFSAELLILRMQHQAKGVIEDESEEKTV